MGKIKNVFTMAILHLINNLANFSSRLLPVFIIVLVLLKLSKVLIDLNWYAVLSIVLLEVILIIFSISFNAVFFKKHKDNKNESTENNNTSQNSENNESTEIAVKENKLPILNVAVAFFAFLGIIFVILKLFKAVTWNWVWVLSPLWLSTALVILILIICIIVFIVSALSKKNKADNIDNNSSETSENNNAENKVNNSEEKTVNEINNNEIADDNKTNEENNK